MTVDNFVSVLVLGTDANCAALTTRTVGVVPVVPVGAAHSSLNGTNRT